MEAEKTKEYLKCELTEEEIKELGAGLARKYSEITDLEDQKKALASDFKSQIDSATALASTMARKIQNGYEFRNVDCEIRKDYIDTTVRLIRLDTGEIVKERPMEPNELQGKLFNQEIEEIETEMKKG